MPVTQDGPSNKDLPGASWMKNLSFITFYFLVLFSLQSKALIINGCEIKPSTSCNDANLSGTDLSYLDLTDASFKRADFIDSFLVYADLTDVKFLSADLTDADLSNATLIGTNFKRADLTNADLSNADISNAFFKFTDLSGADLTNIIGWETASFNKASYSPQTLLPNDMIPQELNMKLVPLPAGITLFLSGLVGLGLLRGRNNKFTYC